MQIKCNTCKSETTLKPGQRYHYKECGLDNIYLDNITLRACESCNIPTPRLPRIQQLHATIARAIALQPYPLSGSEIRFLRKQLGMKAKEWAVLLRIDHTTLSRWEHGTQQIGPQSDALIRFLYFRVLEEKQKEMLNEAVSERIAASGNERKEHPTVSIDMNNPNIYSYHQENSLVEGHIPQSVN